MASARDQETPFRNYLHGMKGKREDLLRRRRDELATMPHALRRIYVARFARILSATAALASGSALVAAASSPEIQQFLASLSPGKYPAVLSTLLVVTTLATTLFYLLGRCIGESRFTRAMVQAALPSDSDDLDGDVSRLGMRLEEVASRKIRRLERPAAALFPLAFAAVGPCLVVYALGFIIKGGYPPEAELEQVITDYSATLVTILIMGALAAATVLFARSRERFLMLSSVILSLNVATALFASVMGIRFSFYGALLVAFASVVSLWWTRRERSVVHSGDESALWSPWQSIVQLAASARQALSREKLSQAWSQPRTRKLVVALSALSAVALFINVGPRTENIAEPTKDMKSASTALSNNAMANDLHSATDSEELPAQNDYLGVYQTVLKGNANLRFYDFVADGTSYVSARAPLPYAGNEPLIIPRGFEATLSLVNHGINAPDDLDLFANGERIATVTGSHWRVESSDTDRQLSVTLRVDSRRHGAVNRGFMYSMVLKRTAPSKDSTVW